MCKVTRGAQSIFDRVARITNPEPGGGRRHQLHEPDRALGRHRIRSARGLDFRDGLKQFRIEIVHRPNDPEERVFVYVITRASQFRTATSNRNQDDYRQKGNGRDL
jgi:hypothetical protein